MNQPLDGIRVVSIEQAAAAPLCTRRLAAAGAEVIKVERPEGDFARGYDSAVAGESSYFVWLNAGKKSVVMDLGAAADLARLRKLIAHADVLVQNLKPGALVRLGLDLDALHAAHPSLISVSISGFHPDGPGAGRKAYDLLMQAESGLADITGSSHAPGRVGVSIVDVATGMHAYEAVLEALIARGRTGSGRALRVALFDAVAELLSVPYLLERYGGAAPERIGLAHPGICPYGVFTSRCGRSFILAVQNEREWQRLCTDAVALPDLLADPRCADNETRVRHRDFVDDTLKVRIETIPYAELAQRLDAAGIAFAPVNPLSSLREHPDFHTSPVQVGEHIIELPRVPGLDKPDGQSIPALGEHTEEVFAWLDSIAD